jgi:ribosomal protein S18 acetylase RimI-like enzyme
VEELEFRWMKKADLSDASRIMMSSGLGIDEKQIDRLISKASVVCMVADLDDRVVGVLIYDVGRVSKVKLIALAVSEDYRRKGVGKGLLSLVTSKLDARRNKIELSVSEYNLTAQLFLRSLGFKAVSVVDNDPSPSEYRFLYKFSESAEKEA